MTEAEHEENIKKIRTETEEIKRQIMKLEFQHKKDIVEARKRSAELDKLIKENIEQTTKQIKYVAKLAGITYEELDNLDFKLQETGRHLIEPREHSIIS